MKSITSWSVLTVALLGVPSLSLAQTTAAPPAPAVAPAKKPVSAAAGKATGATQPAPAATATGATQPAPAATPAAPEAPQKSAVTAAAPAAAPSVPPVDASAAPVPAGQGQPVSSAAAAATAGASDSEVPEALPASAASPVGESTISVAPSGVASASEARTVTAKRPRKTHYPFSLQLDVVPVWHTSNGFDLFSDGDISTRLGVSAGYDLVQLAPKTFLGLELGWTAETLEDHPLSAALNSAFSAHNFHGGLKPRYQLLPFLAPYASVLAGASRMETTFDVPSGGRTFVFETVRWVPFGMFGAGLALSLPVENAVAFGVAAEGGYIVSGAMPLRLDPKHTDGALAVSGANLGSLGRSGPYLRIGFFLRY